MWFKIKSFCNVTKADFSHTWLNIAFRLYFLDNDIHIILRFSLIWNFNIGETMHTNAQKLPCIIFYFLRILEDEMI